MNLKKIGGCSCGHVYTCGCGGQRTMSGPIPRVHGIYVYFERVLAAQVYEPELVLLALM